uniref:Reverse transcriptase zinc-binding domain-containing protein n=1 Tax=Lactuca sativa TaxID=4236 RepID=A0A9R1VYM2_LACSA|nr:hypothetical protein LSAT_V11C300109150 [Lactuca sativa]
MGMSQSSFTILIYYIYGGLKRIQILGNGPRVSHLFYTDYAFFIGEWSRANLKNLARIIRCFHVNFHKSRVFGIGATLQETSNWASLLGCKVEVLPFDYLRVLVGANMNLIKNWKPILKKFHSKLSLWKFLVIYPHTTYHYLRPQRVHYTRWRKLEEPFMGKKIHWVAWDKVLAAKSDGGLGVASIQALNIGLLMKWWWCLKNKKCSLWARVIHGFHNLSNNPFDYLSRQNGSGVWSTIGGIKKELLKHGLGIHDVFKLVVEAGNETLFCYDSWLDSVNLKSKYPSLFELETRKKCSVADRISGATITWNWKSLSLPPSPPLPPDFGLGPAVQALTNYIWDVHLVHGADHYRCKITSDGTYNASSVRKIIDKHVITTAGAMTTHWIKVVPIKVLCFVWRAAQSRIPPTISLETRGIKESAEHVLIECPFASRIRNNFMTWCGVRLDQNLIRNIGDLLHAIDAWGGCPKKRKQLAMICYGMLWNLWRFRNKRLFQQEISLLQATECIKTTIFYWLKHRGKNVICNCNEWLVSPFISL